MPVEEYLAELKDPSRPLLASRLGVLSALLPEESRLFSQVWPQIEVARRRQILRRLLDLAEDNVEMDFDAVFMSALKRRRCGGPRSRRAGALGARGSGRDRSSYRDAEEGPFGNCPRRGRHDTRFVRAAGGVRAVERRGQPAHRGSAAGGNRRHGGVAGGARPRPGIGRCPERVVGAAAASRKRIAAATGAFASAPCTPWVATATPTGCLP